MGHALEVRGHDCEPSLACAIGHDERPAILPQVQAFVDLVGAHIAQHPHADQGSGDVRAAATDQVRDISGGLIGGDNRLSSERHRAQQTTHEKRAARTMTQVSLRNDREA